MAEPRTNCIDCDASILQRTATRLDGRCAHCSSRTRAIPPPDFEVSHALSVRIAALNENPGYYRDLAWRLGEDFAHEALDKHAECKRQHDEWYPRLRAFADQCRKDQPPATNEPNCLSERAQLRIYEDKLIHNRPTSSRDDSVPICTMDLLAIPVALRVWPQDDRRIILTPDETDQWHNMYSLPEDCFPWYSHYSWRIVTSPSPHDELCEDIYSVCCDPTHFKEGETPWLISVGHWHGPLAAAGNTELWAWNGSEARFIMDVSCWVS